MLGGARAEGRATGWKAASDDKWLVPFGGRLGKLPRLWKVPINLDAAVFWNATHPENLSWARRAFRPRAAVILRRREQHP
jgi:hypothetical protein